MTHDDGRQPIAIGHLSDSGDLMINKNIDYFQINEKIHIKFEQKNKSEKSIAGF